VLEGVLGDEDRAEAASGGLEITPVSLQDLVAAYGLGDAVDDGDPADPELATVSPLSERSAS
jgi:ABC-2 type transport system ATP-binding protein